MDVKKGNGGNAVEGDGLVWEDPLERRLPPRRPHSTFQIAGVPVLWPKPLVPFAPQLAVMSRMIAAIQKRYNALLESPTGTGKTLAILGGVLSWQRAEFLARVKDTFKADELSKAAATPVPTPSTSPARTPALDDSATSGSDMDSIPVKNAKELPRPRKIFFSSRTHSQLKQVSLLLLPSFAGCGIRTRCAAGHQGIEALRFLPHLPQQRDAAGHRHTARYPGVIAEKIC